MFPRFTLLMGVFRSLFLMTEDPFATASGSAYPKPEDLENQIILYHTHPSTAKVEMVTNRFDRDGSKPLTERASVDTAVFGPEGTQEYSDMYWSQAVPLAAIKNGLKPGAKQWVAGRLVKVGTKASREALKFGETAADYAEARLGWLKGGGKGPEPKHVWVLADDFTADERKALVSYIEGKSVSTDPFISA